MSGKNKYIISIFVVACLLTACSTSEISKVDFTEIEYHQDPGYEPLPTFDARDLFASRIINSRYYTIDTKVLNNGYNNIYRVVSNYGFYEVQGIHELRKLLREIKAIAIMRRISSSKEFKSSIKDSAAAPLKAVRNLIKHPIDTLTGIPKGALKFTRRLGTMTLEERSEFEDSRTKELIGFSNIKRQYAHHLGVDVFSDNKQLQDHLNHIAWVTYTGDIPMRVAYALIPHPGGLIISAATASKDLNHMVTTTTPEDLRHINRQKLSDMGLTIEPINKFLGHSWLSPRHQTGIVLALEKMDGIRGIEGIIDMATHSHNEQTSSFIQNMLELLAKQHQNTPFKVLHTWNDLILGQTQNNQIVMTLPADHIAWTEHVANSFDSIDKRIATPLNLNHKKLIVTGSISDIAKNELKSRDWTYNVGIERKTETEVSMNLSSE